MTSFPTKCPNCGKGVSLVKFGSGVLTGDELWKCPGCKAEFTVAKPGAKKPTPDEHKRLWRVEVNWEASGSETFEVRADTKDEAEEIAKEDVQLPDCEHVDIRCTTVQMDWPKPGVPLAKVPS